MVKMHDQTKVLVKIVKPDSGVGEFLDGIVIAGKTWFRSDRFKEFDKDEIVECTFRQAEKRGYLLTVRPTKPNPDREAKSIPVRETAFSEGTHSGIWFSKKIARMFDLISHGLDEDRVMVVLLRGASGYGKSSYAEAYAADRGMNFVDINCAAIGDPEEWFGFREAENGSTIFVHNQMTEALKEGNVVINLDEANRIEAYIANTLLPILDHRRKTTVHRQEIVAGPRIVFTLTINEGAKFSGTFSMDQALKNRIDLGINVGPLESEIERQLLIRRYPKVTKHAAKWLVELCTRLRKAIDDDSIQIDVSTRTSLKMAAIMSLGGSFMEAVGFVIEELAEPNEIKPIIDTAKQVEIEMNRSFSHPDSEPAKGSKVIIIETEKPMPNSVKKVELVAIVRYIAQIDMAKAKDIVEDAQRNRKDIRIDVPDGSDVDKLREYLNGKSIKFTVSA